MVAIKHQTRKIFTGLPTTLKDQLAHLFATRPEIEKVILFGSRARGDAEERSDIDLVIVAPTATPQQWLDIEFHLEEADTLLQIEVVRWEEASPSLKKRIATEGKLLYERHQTKAEPE